ncbi:hypothetical protein UlMin_036725 [Ulmus minor]
MSNFHLAKPEQHSTVSGGESEKAWHILTILLSIGGPASPAELACKCQLFKATPDFVRFLCSIPNSPIHLMDNGVVTVSMAAVSVVMEFASQTTIDGSASLFGIRLTDLIRLWNSYLETYFQKRKRLVPDPAVIPDAKRRLLLHSDCGESDQFMLHFPNRIEQASPEGRSNRVRAAAPLLLDSAAKFSTSSMINVDNNEDKDGSRATILPHEENFSSLNTASLHGRLVREEENLNIPKPDRVYRFMASKQDQCLPLHSDFGDSLSQKEALIREVRLKNKADCSTTFCSEENKQDKASPAEAQSCRNMIAQSMENAEDRAVSSGHKGVVDCEANRAVESFVPSKNFAVTGGNITNCLESRNKVNFINSDKEKTCKVETESNFLLSQLSSSQKQSVKSISKLKGVHSKFPPQRRVLIQSLESKADINIPIKSDQKCLSMENNSKNSHNIRGKENTVTSISPKNQVERKELPQFEDFITEDEEGSGGYGTVYRVRRKSDGKRSAIKCPHAKAYKHHVSNELKMLERFGGRNFIIKFEESVKSGDMDCFVLEHVEHDRPEVLRKEIDIFQLQWYGYCLFRALACLHKQGVVHRDIKPGNFLFSRKTNKGYLIDFNLAMDLQLKYAAGSKLKSSYYASFGRVPIPLPNSAPATKDNKLERSDFVSANRGTTEESKSIHEYKKSIKNRTHAAPMKKILDISGAGGNKLRSQGADRSGITSTKDATSARTPSTERKMEPLPSLGRKELISLAQDAIQNLNHTALMSPASQRKRIAAPPGKVDSKIFYMGPMPLYSTGLVAGSGSLKSKGDGKQKREGPCVGTKGFRAPEVLFRSLHQGPKVDVWSSGVTLLYLLIGRMPFTGEPEQNIKEIAKLKGSEDLWEVAKLHDRESSFPVELLDIQSLPSTELQSWCKVHTKRPEFFKQIPRSLFDLVDKCLMVNPRLRISAEEALRHEFFASCHESLRKQRMLRCEVSVDTNNPVHGQS